MKRSILSIILSLFLLLWVTGKAGASTVSHGNDSIRLSLLTCAPGEEIYSLFGHTAIRYEVPSQGIDIVFNYGLFSFNTPNFIWRFSLGETDYQLGATEYRNFEAEYTYYGRSVWQQTLNLTDEEKTTLVRLLQENYLPENRTYRYNFFYDNCATRPRDKIEACITGQIKYPATPPDHSHSFRDIVHQYCKGHPWAKFGIDLCIGSTADRPITQRQMMFAPFYLMDFFKEAQISQNASTRPLVADEKQIIHAELEAANSLWTPTPLQCALFLFALIIVATTYGFRRRKNLWGIDLLLFTAAGVVGCVLSFLTLFSHHPAVAPNYLLLVFHPGHLLLLPYIIYCERKGKRCEYLVLSTVILTLFIIISPFIPQKIDIAIVPLALILLTRSVNNLILTSKKI